MKKALILALVLSAFIPTRAHAEEAKPEWKPIRDFLTLGFVFTEFSPTVMKRDSINALSVFAELSLFKILLLNIRPITWITPSGRVLCVDYNASTGGIAMEGGASLVLLGASFVDEFSGGASYVSGRTDTTVITTTSTWSGESWVNSMLLLDAGVKWAYERGSMESDYHSFHSWDTVTIWGSALDYYAGLRYSRRHLLPSVAAFQEFDAYAYALFSNVERDYGGAVTETNVSTSMVPGFLVGVRYYIVNLMFGYVNEKFYWNAGVTFRIHFDVGKK